MVRRDTPLNFVFVPVLLWILSICSRRDCCLFAALALEGRESVDTLPLEVVVFLVDDGFGLLVVVNAFLGTLAGGGLASPSWQL
jgi:hypothetical protein